MTAEEVKPFRPNVGKISLTVSVNLSRRDLQASRGVRPASAGGSPLLAGVSPLSAGGPPLAAEGSPPASGGFFPAAGGAQPRASRPLTSARLLSTAAERLELAAAVRQEAGDLPALGGVEPEVAAGLRMTPAVLLLLQQMALEEVEIVLQLLAEGAEEPPVSGILLNGVDLIRSA